MKLRKVTDFIRLEEGNIGRKAAVVTGSLLASTLLGAVLTTQIAEAGGCDEPFHNEHYNHINDPHTDIPHQNSTPHYHHCNDMQ